MTAIDREAIRAALDWLGNEEVDPVVQVDCAASILEAALSAHPTEETETEWEYGVQHMDGGRRGDEGVTGWSHGELGPDCRPEGCYRVRRTPEVPAGPWEPVPEGGECDE